MTLSPTVRVYFLQFLPNYRPRGLSKTLHCTWFLYGGFSRLKVFVYFSQPRTRCFLQNKSFGSYRERSTSLNDRFTNFLGLTTFLLQMGFFKTYHLSFKWKLEKSQEEQLIALIYAGDRRRPRINETGRPFLSPPVLRGVLCALFATGRGNRENAKLITTFARGHPT